MNYMFGQAKESFQLSILSICGIEKFGWLVAEKFDSEYLR